MGEYEPKDSRTVTHSTETAPGEPPRTGAREDEARREAQARQQDERRHEKPEALKGDQPQAGHETGGEARPDYDQYEVNQPDNLNKRADPGEEQSFDANDPDPMASPSGPSPEDAAAQGQQQQQQGDGSQSQSMGSMTQSQGPKSMGAQPGYGNARDEDGNMEQDEADAVADADADGGTPGANPAETARIDAARPLGKE